MRRCLFLVAVFAAVLAAPAQAAGPAFGIRALGNWKLGYFVYNGKPGQTLHGKIAISNDGDRVGEVRIFATDATTGQTSGTVYETSGKRPTGVGAWITLPATKLSLGPKERRVIPFTVVVPAGAAAGQHVGGIVAETGAQSTSPQSKGKANVQVTVRNLAIVAVQVNLPGAQVASFTIGKVHVGGRHGFQQVFVRIANTGNVLAKPGISLKVTDDKGNVVLDNRYKLDTILPHTSIDYPVTVSKKALGAGSYTTAVQLDYAKPGGGTATAKATPTVTVTPEQVQQVFTSAGPTAAPPGTTTAAAAPAKSSSGISPTVIVLAIVAGIAILAAVWFAATARARRPRA
ncbi:MAG: WxL protein peptidoglycan domain-containing protein [Gaiellaceae bacterium]